MVHVLGSSAVIGTVNVKAPRRALMVATYYSTAHDDKFVYSTRLRAWHHIPHPLLIHSYCNKVGFKVADD